MKAKHLLSMVGAAVLGATSMYSADVVAEVRIGVVRMGKVLEVAPQAEAARGRLEKEFAARDRELMGLQKELKALMDSAGKDGGASLSDSERSNLEKNLRKKRTQLKRDQDEYREEINLRQNEELGKVQKDVVEAIQAVAKAKEFDLVLMGQAVIYAGDKYDITDAVIAQLKGGRAAAAPAAPVADKLDPMP